MPRMPLPRMPSATAWVALATLFLGGVGIWGVLETRHALELTQRAWVNPLCAQLVRPLEKAKSIHFAVLTMNSGREPARDVNIHLKNTVIDSFNPLTASL